MPGPPRYALGMATRFNVTVDGLNLGDWSGCSGASGCTSPPRESSGRLLQQSNGRHWRLPPVTPSVGSGDS